MEKRRFVAMAVVRARSAEPYVERAGDRGLALPRVRTSMVVSVAPPGCAGWPPHSSPEGRAAAIILRAVSLAGTKLAASSRRAATRPKYVDKAAPNGRSSNRAC